MNILAIILWAFTQWGVSPIPVTIVTEDTPLIAYTYTPANQTIKEIHYDKTYLATAPEADLRSVTLHEVGHVLGLQHYGDCNTTDHMAIMGCANLGYITDYDRLQLFRARERQQTIRTYRLLLPQLSRDW